MSDFKSLSNLERQEQLLKIVESSNRITVADICDIFQISEATARRDLESLAEQGKVQRVHGGAIAIRKAPPELPLHQRMSDQADLKQKIGLAASRLVKEGETVFLGSGTTVLEVARNLINCKNLTVITNSLLVLNVLSEHPHINLVVLGGVLRQSEQSLIGHITEQAVSELRAERAIMGIHSIDAEHGLTNDYLEETMTDRKILKMAKEVIVVADHTKCGRVSTAFLAPVTSIHTFVTDGGAPAEFVNSLRDQGVKVILV